MTKPWTHQAVWKMAEEKMAQRAVVCLYLRMRRARRYYQRDLAKHGDNFITWQSSAAYIEAHNALESVKRVVWHNNWN